LEAAARKEAATAQAEADAEAPAGTRVTGVRREAETMKVAVAATPARKLIVKLADVLVVERLPVPLHVSVKALMEACEDENVASDLFCLAASARRGGGGGSGSLQASSLPDAGGSRRSDAFCAEVFPRKFRAHEYWRGGGGGGGGGGGRGVGRGEGGVGGRDLGVGASGGGGGGTFCTLTREEIIHMENSLMAHKGDTPARP
jgi:hypothetical protein